MSNERIFETIIEEALISLAQKGALIEMLTERDVEAIMNFAPHVKMSEDFMCRLRDRIYCDHDYSRTIRSDG